MADESGDGGADVSYPSLLTDPALLAVFLISSTAAVGINAVPVALPRIATTFAVSEARIGLVMSAFTLPVIVLLPITGVLADIYGRRAVVGAVGIAAIPFAADTLRLSAAVGVYAVGEATLNPVLNDAVAAFADDERRAGIMSSLQILKNAALTLAPALLGSIIAVAGFEGAFLFAAGIVTAYPSASACSSAPTVRPSPEARKLARPTQAFPPISNSGRPESRGRE